MISFYAFEDYQIMKVETSLNLNIACLSWLIWPWEREYGNRFDLHTKSMDSLDVDERHPPIVEVAGAQHHAQMLATFFPMDNPSFVILTYTLKLHAILEKLNKIYFIHLFINALLILSSNPHKF